MNEMNAVLLDPGGEDAKMDAETNVNAKMNTAMNAMDAEMNEKEFDVMAGAKVKVKPKGKVRGRLGVPEAGTAEVKVSDSTGMNKSYPWARMTPLCFNTERVLFRGTIRWKCRLRCCGLTRKFIFIIFSFSFSIYYE